MRKLFIVFLSAATIIALNSCTTETVSNDIYIRVHNTSTTDYLNMKLDPTGTGNSFLQIGDLTPGSFSNYVQVSTSKSEPIIDVTCFYANYQYTPATNSDVNNPGRYTYHVNLLTDINNQHYLTVSQSSDE